MASNPVASLLALAIALSLAACDSGGSAPAQPGDTADVPTPAVTIDPANWPQQEAPLERDAAIEARIADLIGRMTLEEKVGQVIQADLGSVTPEDVREYNLGSVLNGGGSAPGGDNRAPAPEWLAFADSVWDASVDTSDGGLGIPAMWGVDAVHGHNNIVGATLFPHNIGLGMANDPDLIEEIGRITALEILATGADWTFAPTIAVARNDRWGRTFESYSEDPRIVAAYAPRVVEGLQGVLGSDEFLDEDHVVATAKHFVGDGGTTGGIDQGDTATSEAELRDVHAAGYPPAIRAGVQSVMASFNSFHGRKMHGYRAMLHDVLVEQMGFDGFVVGDWNGHGQVAGCTNFSCAQSINAGLDMFMAPNSWEELYGNLLDQARSGEVSMERLEEAVARILRVKARMGLLDDVRPSARKHAGNFALLGAPEHRAVARDAVRKSLVLLKNDAGVLPIAPSLNVLVAGDGAHDIGKQSGGWTLSWQGTGNRREHFPNASSIFEGIRDAVVAGGGTATLSEDGSYDEAPDVAIVVFGEDPYAEGVGDRPHVDFASDDGLDLLTSFRDAGIPTASVFLSGRPMWVNPELNASDAFVAAWLPGSEGAGIADVLVAAADGTPNHDFQGRLSFSWPRTADQVDVNVGDPDYDPLFAYGYGLTYADAAAVGKVSADAGIALLADEGAGRLVESGDPTDAWQMLLRDPAGDQEIPDSRGASPGGALAAEPADRDVQEDTVVLSWTGPASVVLAGDAVDLTEEAGQGMALELRYQVLGAGSESITLAVGDGVIDVTDKINGEYDRSWRETVLRLSCFADQGADLSVVSEPLTITSSGPLRLQLASARIVANLGDASCGENP